MIRNNIGVVVGVDVVGHRNIARHVTEHSRLELSGTLLLSLSESDVEVLAADLLAVEVNDGLVGLLSGREADETRASRARAAHTRSLC